MINALKYVEDLEKAGFTKEQAEMTIQVWTNFVADSLATKDHFKDLSHRIDLLEVNIDKRVDSLEAKLTIRLGLMLAFGISAIATMIKLL